MRKLPPLRALHAFEAAARHLSFAAAAKEFGVTPTAISHQIKQLEEACGVTLFQRRPRPLLLTSAGARLYPALRNGFDALASALTLLAEAEVQAPLRLTSTNAFASKWLVPQLPKWREENPDIPLEIIGTDTILDVRAGAADVAIRHARKPPLDYVTHEVFRDAYVPVCSPRLLQQHGPIERAADLLRLPLIHYDWINSRSADLAAMARCRPLDRSRFQRHRKGPRPQLQRRVARHRRRDRRTGGCDRQRRHCQQ